MQRRKRVLREGHRRIVEALEAVKEERKEISGEFKTAEKEYKKIGRELTWLLTSH